MLHGLYGKPGDVRGFVHRTIGRIAGRLGGILPGPVGGVLRVGGRLLGGSALTLTAEQVRQRGGRHGRGCGPPAFRLANDDCVMPTAANLAQEARETGVPFIGQDPQDWASPSSGFGRPVGEAVMGRYGAAMQPFARSTTTSFCLPGMVLGDDNLCYNRGEVPNKRRKWPRGRRPLLTGGDMRCISIANAAARKLQRKEKQLQSMGMLKKPAPRPRQKLLAAGHHAHIEHN